ncbi:MAG: histidinol-phosphatase HisJ family protein [Nanobdellota archaeon]
MSGFFWGMFDYHVHTNYTFDARSTVDEYCQATSAAGIDEICFTNHQEANLTRGRYKLALTRREWGRHFKEVELARQQYPELTLRVGVELGYYPGMEATLEAFTAKYPFDYVLGSVHSVNEQMISAPMTRAVSIDEANEVAHDYFSLVKQAISSELFDAIGHIELPRKQLPGLPFQVYRDELLECGELMLRHDVGFEVNTGGYRHQAGETYPQPAALEMLCELGVTKVSMGSDAHMTPELGHEFPTAVALLKRCGYGSLCRYENRVALSQKL